MPWRSPLFFESLKNLSFNSQIKADKIRNFELQKLRDAKKSDYNRITVHNRTSYEIPSEVIDLLSLGKNRGVGSFNDLSCENFIQMDKLFSAFQKQAQNNDISEVDIAGIKSHRTLAGISMSNAKTLDPRTKILKDLGILVVGCDVSKDEDIDKLIVQVRGGQLHL